MIIYRSTLPDFYHLVFVVGGWLLHKSHILTVDFAFPRSEMVTWCSVGPFPFRTYPESSSSINSRHSAILFVRLSAWIAGHIHWRSIYCIVLLHTIVYLTCYLQVCRPPKAERQNATWPCYDYQQFINQQPATRCYPITFSSWWNDDLMPLMHIMNCPASHYSDVYAVNSDS